MKEFNRIKAERRKEIKKRRKVVYGNGTTGRSFKRFKNADSDEEDGYFDMDDSSKRDDNDTNYKILTELTLWRLNGNIEQGLKGMSVGNVDDSIKDLFAIRGEWKLQGD